MNHFKKRTRVVIRSIIFYFNYFKMILLNFKVWRNKNKFPTFYLIRFKTNVGLFSYFIQALGHIDFAIKKGLTPYIDLETYENTYLTKEKVNLENSWNYYFNQLTDNTLLDIINSKKYINALPYPIRWPEDNDNFFDNIKNQKRWIKLAKKYIKINPEIEKNALNKFKNMFNDSDRVLGLKVRGTDYQKLKPKSHAIQPDLDSIIKVVSKLLISYKCNKILLATEDQDYYEKLKEVFGNRLFSADNFRITYNGQGYITESLDTTKSKKEIGTQYLSSILMLSYCNVFVSGRNSGSIGVLLFQKNFEFTYIFNLGYY